jgi:hypothetical protein
MLFAGKWIELEISVLSVFSLMCGIWGERNETGHECKRGSIMDKEKRWRGWDKTVLNG